MDGVNGVAMAALAAWGMLLGAEIVGMGTLVVEAHSIKDSILGMLALNAFLAIITIPILWFA